MSYDLVYLRHPLNFGHANIIKYCDRPFDSAEEMDEKLIENWNSRVGPKDWVYHLGDFAFKDPKEYARRLQGRIILVLGNHDHKRLSALKECFGYVHELLTIKEFGHSISLCHYGMRVWHKAHFNSWHLYGHSHGKLPAYGKSSDVGVDCTNFRPINIYEVEEVMKTRPDNPGLIRKLDGINNQIKSDDPERQ